MLSLVLGRWQKGVIIFPAGSQKGYIFGRAEANALRGSIPEPTRVTRHGLYEHWHCDSDPENPTLAYLRSLNPLGKCIKSEYL